MMARRRQTLDHASRIAGEQCRKINSAVPSAVAYEIVPMFEILRGFANRNIGDSLCIEAKRLIERATRQPGEVAA